MKARTASERDGLVGRPLRGQKAFVLYFIGQAVSEFGSNITPVALAFAVLSATRSPAGLGIIFTVGTLPMLLLLLIGGVVSDRFPARRVMMLSDIVRSISQTLLAVVVGSGHAAMPELIALYAIAKAAEAFFGPAARCVLPEILDPGNLLRANSMIGSARGLARVAGPAIAGILIAGLGAGTALAVDAATFAFSVLSLAVMGFFANHAPPEAMPVRTSIVKEIREGWKTVRTRRWLIEIIVWSALFEGAVRAPLFIAGPVVSAARFGGAAAWGYIATAFAAGSLLGSAGAAKTPVAARLHSVVLAPFLFSLPLIALALSASVPLIAISAAAAGASWTFAAVNWLTLLQERLPRNMLARVSAFDLLGPAVAMSIGYAFGGITISRYGTMPVLLCSAAWLIVSSTVLIASPGVRHELKEAI